MKYALLIYNTPEARELPEEQLSTKSFPGCRASSAASS
jgi:hypothetical protein